MALVLQDRVQETTATTGTGTITLGGAVSGFQTFAVIGNGNSTFYCIVNGSSWEVGIGTYSTTGPTLTRTTILSNSNGNTAPITLVGASNVFCTYPSEKSVNIDANGSVNILTNVPNTSTTVGTLNVGDGTYNFAQLGQLATFASAEPVVNTVTVQNTSSSNTAYSSIQVGANNYNTGYFLELGTNSSTYSYSAAGYPNNSVNQPNVNYIESNMADLGIVTWNNNNIHFIQNASTATTDSMTLYASGGVSLGGNPDPGLGTLYANNVYLGFNTITAAAGTTVLTNASSGWQQVVGTTTQTIQLPNATTLYKGLAFTIANNSTGNVTIKDSASTTIDTTVTGGTSILVLTANGTTAGTWVAYSYIPSSYDFSTTTANFGTATLTNGTWNGNPIAYNYGGTGLTTFGAANNALYSTSANALTAGTLPIAAGGTGQTTANAALNALLPSQTSKTNYFLQTNGSTTAWTLITPALVSDQSNTSTGYFSLPVGTSTQRPGTPNSGMTRVNSDIGAIESYYGGVWEVVAWFTVPNAPTIGTATTTGATSATVTYTAPSNTGGPGNTITSYTAVASPGGATGTVSQSGSGTITVSGLTTGTTYTFTVYATNQAGNSAASAASNAITTLSVPGAPTIGTATVTGSTSVSVAYTAPTNNGGTPITSYTAVSSPGGLTGTVSTSGSGSITVSGLTPNTAYTFTVYATNAIGNGSSSAASNSVTTWTVPNAPTIGTAALGSPGQTKATISYTAPSFNGGTPITSYTAVSSPGGITGTLSTSGSGTITVSGLTANTTYTFTVYATNAVGNSASSAASNSITTLNTSYSSTYLVVAGGGGGGGTPSGSGAGGAGGAGGYLTGTQTLTVGSTYTATVGGGGAGGGATSGTVGNNSTLTGVATTASGGGRGGGYSTAGGAGGSGGGGGYPGQGGGSGTAGQGNAGGTGMSNGAAPYYGGAGGGSAAVGQSGAAGGTGGAATQNSITGTAIYYAGGGSTGSTASTGNTGGVVGNPGTAGSANTGGGGGGGSNNASSSTGGAGGSGVVIISVPTTYYTGTVTGSPTVTTSGSNTIIKFTASGTYVA